MRETDELRRKWSHLQFYAKKKAATFTNSSRRTGGGVNEASPLTEEEEKVLSTIHQDAIEGVPGGIDTSEDQQQVEVSMIVPPPPKKSKKLSVSSNSFCCDRLTTLQEDMNATLLRIDSNLERIAGALESLAKK